MAKKTTDHLNSVREIVISNISYQKKVRSDVPPSRTKNGEI